jgi:hypothetical protein
MEAHEPVLLEILSNEVARLLEEEYKANHRLADERLQDEISVDIDKSVASVFGKQSDIYRELYSYYLIPLVNRAVISGRKKYDQIGSDDWKYSKVMRTYDRLYMKLSNIFEDMFNKQQYGDDKEKIKEMRRKVDPVNFLSPVDFMKVIQQFKEDNDVYIPQDTIDDFYSTVVDLG